MNILMIGCGRMGGILAAAWAQSHRVVAFEPTAALPDGVERVASLDAGGIPSPVVVVIAVKPQVFPDIAPLLEPLAKRGVVFVSIMAGVTTDTFRAALGASTPLIRAMPNTPAAAGMGATGLFAAPELAQPARVTAEALFGTVGEFVWLMNESLFDAVTALSGSGPAYFFRFAEALASAGEQVGLPRDVAVRLARWTLQGAGALAASDHGASLATLREAVTSPGGTTAAGLAAMHDPIDEITRAMVSAAAQRSRELAVKRK